MCLNGLISIPRWLCYLDTGDREFLKEIAYPVLRECGRFMAAYCTERPDGNRAHGFLGALGPNQPVAPRSEPQATRKED
jgi:hypothetical protein